MCGTTSVIERSSSSSSRSFACARLRSSISVFVPYQLTISPASSALEAGPVDGPAVVLLHGFTGHARSWDTFAAQMQEKYRVLALDQRGRVVGHEHQAVLPDLDLVAALQLDLVDPVAVHVGPVERTDVGDPEPVGAATELCVPARDGHVVEEDVGVRVTPDGGQIGIEQEPRAHIRTAPHHEQRRPGGAGEYSHRGAG